MSPQKDSGERPRAERREAAAPVEHSTPTDSIAHTGPTAILAAGSLFATYEIESRLAMGGMAEVWRAKIKGFEKRIVIKTMLPQFQERPDVVAMFVNEASLAARLSHPNIVDIIDFGQLQGRYFIAMEYVSGLTLRFALKRMLTRGERLPIAAVLHLMRDVCEALDHMHDLEDAEGPMGLLHRDLSPDNILISMSGSAKLIDFGAARATKRTHRPRAFVGKFRYAAPERIRLAVEDRRSDVYSAGVILYECLTGVRPFSGSDAEVISAIASSPGCDPLLVVPSLPVELAAVVKRATAPHPDDRFASARDLGIALARCLSDLGAASKEREVTSALSRVLDEPESPPVSIVDDDDAVTEAMGPADSAPQSNSAVVLSEMEILDASGPIGAVVAPLSIQADTQRIELPIPPEAFRPSHPEPPGSRTTTPATVSIFAGGARVAGWKISGAPGKPRQVPVERAVEYFDRGLQLRLAGRFGEALDAWERALAIAPSNLLYQSHVYRLRAQLHLLRARALFAGDS